MVLTSKVSGWKNTDTYFFSPGGTMPEVVGHEKAWSLVSVSGATSILKGALTCGASRRQQGSDHRVEKSVITEVPSQGGQGS